MKKFIVCSALLVLFFATTTSASECRRPKEVLGKGKLEQQNKIIDEFGVSRMEYVSSIRSYVSEGKLLRLLDRGRGFFLGDIGKNSEYKGCEDYPYPDDLKFAHPAAHAFVQYIGEWWFMLHPDTPLKINGGIRTPKWQVLLGKCNGNAVREKALSKQSAHFSGLALDFSKKDLTHEQVCDLWALCMELQKDGLAICVDEQNQNNLHVFVHPRFLDWNIKLIGADY